MKTFRLLSAVLALAAMPAAWGLTLSPDAPTRYVVQSGDTLWSLAGKYLSDPWSWAELWHAGAGIDNPNRIYPGDVLILAMDAEGHPHLTIESAETAPDASISVRLSPTVRAEPLPALIPVIPHDIAASFMGRPTLLATDDVKTLPYVLGFEHDRLAGAAGTRLYARRMPNHASGLFSVVHAGDPVADPVTKRIIGVQAVYTGTARVDSPTPGARGVSSLTLIASARESLPGDRLVPDTDEVQPDLSPHRPSEPVEARIAAVIDGVHVIGQYQVVLLNQGRRAGLEPGHVLTLWHEAGSLPDRGPGDPTHQNDFTAFHRSVALPPESAGSLLVFRVYPEASYGLVLQTNSELRVGDAARSPNK
jgi:LysM domain